MTLVAFLCACAPSPGAIPTGQVATSPAGNWKIEFTQSGGFIGISRSVEVTSAGHFVATDKRSGTSAKKELSPEELGALSKLFSQALAAEQPHKPSACADCYIYDLVLTSDGRSTQLHLDDTNLPKSDAEPLVTHLQQLRDSVLKSP